MCVTISIELIFSITYEYNSKNTFKEFVGSKLPVGSSASKSFGEFIILAIAILCLSPPEI
nr:hypothetical protein [Wolbachia endosymbiont of Atemnus politus]